MWLENDLKKSFDEEGGKGEKTRIINEALRMYFKENWYLIYVYINIYVNVYEKGFPEFI